MRANLKLNQGIILGVLAGALLADGAHSQSADALVNKLVEKGILTEAEAQQLKTEAAQTNAVTPAPASKWKISDAIKSVGLFGDVRLRYEYRSAENAPGSGASPSGSYNRERFRYAARVGIKGDLFEDFYYGLRLETSTNPRSPWVTFGDDSNPTPWAKNSDGINIGQVYLGWKPTDWYEMTVGKMPNPLYVTPMIWDTDLNPEGAVEKFKHALGRVELFANFGQFLYQDSNPDHGIPSSDTFMLAWQVGANVKLPRDMSFKIAPVIYNYTGVGQANGLNTPYSGQGLNGINVNTNGFNQNGINDLLVLEVPGEFNFKLGRWNARAFGDFAYNFYGDRRAEAAARVTPPTGGLARAFTDETKAYQAGFGFGNGGAVYGPTSGLVYGSTSKKGTWEGRAYYQHIEQYAADVNLLDSDFFEGRANLQGAYTAFAYSITDNIIGTFRYGYAQRINENLGTGGNNPDLPVLNPIRNYHLFQLDLTLRF